MGSTDPGGQSTVTDATFITVGGVGGITYDLSCSAQDFVNLDSGAAMQTLPAGALSYSADGFATVGWQPFSTLPSLVNSATGGRHRWSHQYVFDYRLTVPWTFEAGTYTTTVMYTAVPN